MRRVEVYMEAATGTPVSAVSTPPVVVLRMSDEEVIAGMVSGPGFGEAAQEFAKAMASEPQEDRLRRSVQAAVAAMDIRWKNISQEDRDDLGWSEPSSGAALHIREDSCHSIWLGTINIFHLRAGQLVAANTPHTMYERLRSAGQAKPDDRTRGIFTRWLSSQHQPEAARWKVQPGDTVILSSRFIDDAVVQVSLGTAGPALLAERLLAAVRDARPAVGHRVLVCAINAAGEG